MCDGFQGFFIKIKVKFRATKIVKKINHIFTDFVFKALYRLSGKPRSLSAVSSTAARGSVRGSVEKTVSGLVVLLQNGNQSIKIFKKFRSGLR